VVVLIDRVELKRDGKGVIRLHSEDGGPFASASARGKAVVDVLDITMGIAHLLDRHFDDNLRFPSDANRDGSLIYIDVDKTMKQLMIALPDGKVFDQEKTTGGKAFEEVNFVLGGTVAHFKRGTVGKFVSADDPARYVLWMKMPAGLYGGLARST